jgi:pimeloyl-ACP methyl ester carboxylesterase
MAVIAVPQLESVQVHGHRRAFVRAGDGPPVLLLHGMGCDHTTWLPVLARLARSHTVIAPDLLGHGASDKPRADYSLGGYANGMRDLLTILGIGRVTVVGHSFGGGVAMQFAYQFPERTQRLALVCPGGLGRELALSIRALTVPGAGPALALASIPPVHAVASRLMLLLHATGLPQAADLAHAAAVYGSQRDPAARWALIHVLRAAADWRGQVVTMRDRGYLAANMPVAVIWGENDTVIPAAHARTAVETFPHAQVTVIEGAAHFPHQDQPERFVEALEHFMSTTAPSQHDRRRWRALLLSGGVRPSVPAPAELGTG